MKRSYDLELAIEKWKRRLLAAGNLDEGEVEEIEDHLRSRIARKIDEGSSERQAFQFATDKIGEFKAINEEYAQAKFAGNMSLARTLLPDILIHYFKAASRSLSRNRLNTLLNVACLSIGLMCIFFISHFIAFHLSVDDLYEDKGLYRVVYHVIDGDTDDFSPHGPVPFAPTVKEEVPEVSDAVRIWMSSPVLKVDDELFYEDGMIFTDPSFFQFFDLPLLLGDQATALSRPQTVVISESMATKYFGDQDPIGQVVHYDGYPAGQVALEITGVFKELPENTHLDFNLAATLVSMDTERNNWGSFKPIYTYLTLHHEEKASTETKLNQLVDKYMSYRRTDADLFEYHLEPVEDIHIRSDVASAMKPAINASLLWTMAATGLLILLLSAINYINLSLAQLYNQFREVGIRKVFGATRQQIRARFFVAGVVTLALSMALAGGLVMLLIDRYEQLSGLHLEWASLQTYRFFWPLVGTAMAVCLAAVYIPSIRLSSLRLQPALRQKLSTSRSGLRSVFVLIQFVLSSVLLVGTLLMQDQIHYIFNRELGVDSDYVVAIRRPPLDQAFRDALDQNPIIQSFAYSQLLPLNEMSYDGRRINRPGDPVNYSAMSCFSSPEYLQTYDIALIAGRAFSDNIQSDSAAFIINEQAVKAYGFDSPSAALGETLIWSGAVEGKIVGVIRDFHLRSLHEEIGPLVLLRIGQENWYNQYLSVKIHPGQREATIDFLQSNFSQYVDDMPFDYFYIDESYQLIHAEDLNFSRLAVVFSSIAIIIALMGLFGLVNIDLNKMMKEIGIRKVLGSSVRGIFALICYDYVLRILVAFALSVPMAVYFIALWLEQYAYRTSIRPSTIVIGGLLIVFISVITISWKTYRAAVVNPARLLKEE